MPQELLSTIVNEEAARRDRARRFERLTTKRADLLRAIERLEQTPREPIADFEQMLKLAGGIPEKYVTRGRRVGGSGGGPFGGRGSDFVPLSGGLEARGLIQQIIADIIDGAQRHQADLDDTLARARKMLVETDAALQEFA
jgi:hypothetical protein